MHRELPEAQRELSPRSFGTHVHAAAQPAPPRRFNIAAALPDLAARSPELTAVVAARGTGYHSLTYAELDRRSDAIAAGLCERGLPAGSRVSLFVPAGIDMVAITFALFKAGMIPVLIDPGMGRENLLACIERVRPRALIAVPRAHLARRLFPRAFRTVELAVNTGSLWFPGTLRLSAIQASAARTPILCDTAASDQAAILFTSGSTGPPKGVVYTHGMFGAQIRALKELYGMRPGEVDLACFPLFALFDAALEMTSVFPRMDVTRPGACDPRHILRAIEDWRPTSTFGSPAIWRRVVPWCIEHGLSLPTLKRVMIAGAPVPPSLIEGFRSILAPGADVHTPYGATEALPVSSISGAEILGEVRAATEGGAGTCVGRLAPGIDLCVIRISDDPIPTWEDGLEVAPGELGEICVAGPVVTHEYEFNQAATQAAKITESGRTWHRMGDLGYQDSQGRLWFCGRKSHRLETTRGTLPAVPVENVFNVHPDVHRSALVGVGPSGEERGVLVVELEPHARRRKRAELTSEILALGERHPEAERVRELLFHPGLPVDVRHNAKIHRLELKRWAEGRLA